ncbi:MAG: hypothetical protein KC656_20810, partial [Myxococcales bacterium]|nr:hypothetical protein [Myxococcales bacterium]
MLLPEPFRPDDPALDELAQRPWFAVVERGGEPSVRQLTPDEATAALDRLRACEVRVLRRRHQRLWGPLVGYRRDGDVLVAVEVHEVDMDPIEDGSWSSWFRLGVDWCQVAAEK